jgi:hypothetical protein
MKKNINSRNNSYIRLKKLSPYDLDKTLNKLNTLFSLALCGWGTWSASLRKDHKLHMFGNKVIWKYFVLGEIKLVAK